MLPSRCRMWIAILSMFCAAQSVLAGEHMSISAPTKIKPESRVTISWSGGKPTYTVRILVNSHELSESKSIADTWYTWTAQGVNNGDQVQFYVYDSAGASTKSLHIPVRVKAGLSDDPGRKTGESKTKQQVTGDTAETSSESKATLEDDGNEVVKNTKNTTSTSTTTGTRSGRIPTAPPQSSYAPDSIRTTLLSESDTSSSSSVAPTSGAPASETISAPTTSPAAAPSTADPATPPSTGATAASSPDRTNLYLGLIGILIALVLLLVLVWWWRKQTGSSARDDDDDDDDDSRRTRADQDREQYRSLPKNLTNQRRTRMRNAQGLNVAERALLRSGSEEGQSSDAGERD